MNEIKKNNSLYFNIYLFLSTFSRNLIEVFIGIILYKKGFNLKDVILYYLIVNSISLLITKKFIRISKKVSNRVLAIIGIISFILLQILLNEVKVNYLYLFLTSLLFAIYRRGYWISRRFYSLKIIQKKDIALKYSLISIVNQIAIIISSYLGSLLLEFINIRVLTIISISLFIISIIPLYKLKFEHEYNNIELNLFKSFKLIGKSNLYIMGSYEILNVIKFLFPLYIFIYVKDNFQIIGFISLLQGLATIVFSYLYGKTINKEKNYLRLSIILTSIIYILKTNTVGLLLFLISFLEGLITKMYEISISKNFYELSKKYEYYNYNYAYEFIQNFFRTFILIICYLFIKDIKIMIYICILSQLIGVFLNFKITKEKDFENKDKLISI